MTITSDIISNSIVPQPTKEMFDFYHKRTNEHIQRVQNNLKSILDYLPNSIDKGTLIQRIKNHDKSKYSSKKEYIPYVWKTWWHKIDEENGNFDMPEGTEKEFDNAWKHHYTVNSHHPEYYKKPSFMTNEDLVEMLCDWNAMSQELNNSLKEWADNNVGKRWKFKPEQVKFIYKLVDIFDSKTKMNTSNVIANSIISSTYSKDELLSKIKIKVHLTCDEFANYQIESFFTEAIKLADKKKLKGNDHTKYAMAVIKNKLGPDCCKKLGWKYKGTYESVKPERQVKEFTFEKGDKVLVDLRHDEYVQGFKLGKIIKQNPMFTVIEYYDKTVQSLPSNYRKIIGITKGNKKIRSIIKGRPKDVIKNLVDRVINQPDERVKINRSKKPKKFSRST